MKAYKLPNGNLLIPVAVEGPGGLEGDGMVEVKPGSPGYKAWLPYAVDEKPK